MRQGNTVNTNLRNLVFVQGTIGYSSGCFRVSTGLPKNIDNKNEC